MTIPGAFGELFAAVKGELNERARRLLAGAHAKALGHGGIAEVSRQTGLAPATVRAGVRELEQPDTSWTPGRVRRPGGGRKKTVDKDPTLKRDLEQLIKPVTRGDPESPLLWVAKSVRKLAAELQSQGHQVSRRIVAELLDELGYSLQANRKTREGGQHPDRNAQFEYINEAVNRQIATGNPAISVDTKKKELVGDFKNAGREWRPKGDPEPVRVHDFKIPELGKVAPYGIYDISRNTGWVSVGIDNDTAEFSVQSIRTWWNEIGKANYPSSSSLLITADCGGSNGARVRLWKLELQKFADELQMPITVAHLPPGTSKWNKIEHRLFSFISQNWRGKPLISHAAIVSLIAATTTETGLTVRAKLDSASYTKGRKVTDQQMASINIRHHDFHGEWNYTISPTPRSHADNARLIS
jgi:hypothetical protein